MSIYTIFRSNTNQQSIVTIQQLAVAATNGQPLSSKDIRLLCSISMKNGVARQFVYDALLNPQVVDTSKQSTFQQLCQRLGEYLGETPINVLKLIDATASDLTGKRVRRTFVHAA